MTPQDPPHPNPEQWAAFLYGELAPAAHAALQRHLESCPECGTQIQAWRTAQTALDAWRLPAATTPVRTPRARPLLRWAVAALVLLSLGLAAGRFTAPRVDQEALAAALRQQLRQEFRADLRNAVAAVNDRADRRMEDLTAAWTQSRQQDAQTTLALFARGERQRQADFASLRRDLDTLAVNADARFDTTQRTLGQLASASHQLSNRSDP